MALTVRLSKADQKVLDDLKARLDMKSCTKVLLKCLHEYENDKARIGELSKQLNDLHLEHWNLKGALENYLVAKDELNKLMAKLNPSPGD